MAHVVFEGGGLAHPMAEPLDQDGYGLLLVDGECAFGGEHVGGPLHLFGDEGRGDLGFVLFGLDEPLRGGDNVLEQFGLRGDGF